MNENILQYLAEQHPKPDDRCGFFMSRDKVICAQDGLECSYQKPYEGGQCTPETCMFYGVSSVPVGGWDNAVVDDD